MHWQQLKKQKQQNKLTKKNKVMKKKIQKTKLYDVDLDMMVSLNYHVKAKNAAEAKKKGFEIFKKRLARKHFRIYADRIDD